MVFAQPENNNRQSQTRQLTKTGSTVCSFGAWLICSERVWEPLSLRNVDHLQNRHLEDKKKGEGWKAYCIAGNINEGCDMFGSEVFLPPVEDGNPPPPLFLYFVFHSLFSFILSFLFSFFFSFLFFFLSFLFPFFSFIFLLLFYFSFCFFYAGPSMRAVICLGLRLPASCWRW